MSNAAIPKNRDKSAEDLKHLFEPKTIAVIGASTREGSVGYDIFNNLIKGGFKGTLYGVNPKGGSLAGYNLQKSVKDITEKVEMAVIIVPSTAVPAALKECAEIGVKGVIIISAGFKEVGPEGALLEEEVKKIVRESGISLIGPNCLGVINVSENVMMNASFAPQMPKRGNVTFLTQSGALGTAVLDFAQGRNIGFSKFASFGNKADVTETDFLRYLANDKETKVILMYLEDITDSSGFIRLSRELTGDCENKKPIIAFKSGRTSQGAKAAKSHTGSLAGSEAAYDALFTQSGILRANTIEEFLDYGICFATEPLPKGNRVAIITNAGGPGIIATDAVISNGLTMAQLSDSTIQELRKCLPPAASYANPVDVLGDAKDERYKAAIDLVMKDDNVDSVIIILTPQSMTNAKEIAQMIVKAVKGRKKPVLCSFMGSVDVQEGIDILEDNDVPNYIFPEPAARSLAGMVRYEQWVERKRYKQTLYPVDKTRAAVVFKKIRDAGRLEVTEYEALEILAAYGFSILEYGLATTAKEAFDITKKIGKRVVLKIMSPDILHKSDVGGVRLNIATPEQAEAEFNDMMAKIKVLKPDAKIMGALIEEMAEKGGKEVILGAKKDPSFGPLLMFGFGGIFVEVFKDVSFRIAPLRDHGAQLMIESVKAYKLLQGVRGEAPSDIAAIKESLLRLSQLVMDFPEIDELDINPLIVLKEDKGCKVADIRILLSN